jgi:hypothetical protein
MRGKNFKRIRLFLLALLLIAPLMMFSDHFTSLLPGDSPLLLKELEVPAAAGWVDTGLAVKEGEKYEFKASGTISCQKGNPVANCGPEGLDLQTVQQPLTDRNLGALIGKVVKVIGVRKDEETGEEIKEEVEKVFYIGEKAEVEMPLEGQLYLGVNDNVYADNDGKFVVRIFKKE